MPLPEISRSMLKNSLVLGLFAIVTVSLAAFTQLATAPKIAESERAVQTRMLAEVLPVGSYDNHLQDSQRLLDDPLLGNHKPAPAYLATLNGKPTAVILQITAADGYNGSIVMLVGILADGRLAGVRVIRHRETPGLGDRIDLIKSPWILGFDGKSLDNPVLEDWAVKKDGGQFDQMAGATITPRAVVKAVRQALQYFDAHQAQLLQPLEKAHD